MSRNLIIFIIIIFLVIGGIIVYAKSSFKQTKSLDNSQYKLDVLQGPQTQDQNTNKSMNQNTITELKIEDQTTGTGSAVKTGDTVEVNYIGTLLNGTKFDSSYDHHQTFSFTVGGGQVIQGWDQGLVGMQIGGKRKLTIPSSLAYGEQGAPPVIPPNSPLIFEIELVSIK